MSLKRKYGSSSIPFLIKSVKTEPGTYALTTEQQTHQPTQQTLVCQVNISTLGTSTTTTVLRPFVRDYRVSRYQKKHSPTHHPDHHPIFISFFYLPRSTESSLFKLRAWQSFCTTSFHVLFGLPLGLEPSTSYSIHFFT